MVTLPRQKPVPRHRLRPGLRNEPVFHRRHQLQADAPPVELFLKPVAGLCHCKRRVLIAAGTVRRADRPLIAPLGQLSGKENGFFQSLGTVVEPGQDMAVAVEFHKAKIRIISAMGAAAESSRRAAGNYFSAGLPKNQFPLRCPPPLPERHGFPHGFAAFPAGREARLSNFRKPALQRPNRLCCGTRLFGRFASNSLKQSSHSEDRRFIPIRAASGTAFLRKSSRTSPAAGNPLRSGSSAQLIHNNAFKVFREFRGRPGNRFRKQRVVIV